MANFEEFFKGLSADITKLAVDSFSDYKKEAKQEAEALMLKMQNSLSRWTQNLALGQITIEDYEFQVKAQMALLEMNALKQLGLSKVKIDTFKNAALKLIIEKVMAIC